MRFEAITVNVTTCSSHALGVWMMTSRCAQLALTETAPPIGSAPIQSIPITRSATRMLALFLALPFTQDLPLAGKAPGVRSILPLRTSPRPTSSAALHPLADDVPLFVEPHPKLLHRPPRLPPLHDLVL